MTNRNKKIKVQTYFFILIFSFSLASCHNKQREIKFIINDSAARYVLADLRRAKIEKEIIWERYKGFQIVREWHKQNGTPEADLLKEGIEQSKVDTAFATGLIKIIDDVQMLYKAHNREISNHILSFLPSKDGYDVNIYIIALSVCTGCSMNDDIMVDIVASYKSNAAHLLNSMIHEAFHNGYGYCNPNFVLLDSIPKNKKTFLRKILIYLQNEGMATYAGYTTRKIIPLQFKKDEPNLLSQDYSLLEDNSSVRKAISQVNYLIEKTNYMSLDSLDKVAWNLGVMQRSYYVTGAYISKTIEAKYGREHLAGLIKKDETVFIKEYNDIVQKEYQIELLKETK